MKKKYLVTAIFLYIIMLICFGSIGYASWCYQESANKSTSCGGLDTGEYSLDNIVDVMDAIDGDWTSYTAEATGTERYEYMNYSKPTYALSTSLWQIDGGEGLATRNITIPLTCWNMPHLSFVVEHDNSHVWWFCFNGTNHSTPLVNWEYLNSTPTQRVYEEAMWWNQIDFNVTFSNYYEYSSTNYTRNLTYNINYTCPSSYKTDILILVNGSINYSTTTTCLGDNYSLLTGILNQEHEGHRNITIKINSTSANFSFTHEQTFVFDNLRPTIEYINFTFANGFNNYLTNTTVRCNDSIAPVINYNISFNGNQFYYNNLTPETNLSNQTFLRDGTNILSASCSDVFSSVSETLSRTVESKTIILIDEVDNTRFNVNNVTSARLYFDDNHSYYDFKTESNKNETNITTVDDHQIRIELKYSNGDIITRWIDLSITDDDEIRVCANKDNVQHYEQLIISSAQKEVTLESIFANCVVAQDYTRFSYQNSLVLKAFTIQTLYKLHTLDSDGDRIVLASMDGSINTYYNIDTLEYNRKGYNLGIGKESLVIAVQNNNINILYRNLDEDIASLNITITRDDTNAIIFQDSTTTNTSDYAMVFDSTTLNLSRNQLLNFEINVIDNNGDITTQTRQFTLGGRQNYISSKLAFVLSLLTVIFGLTFTISRLSMGWFGLFIGLASMAILSLGSMEWYSTMLMAMEVIITLFISLLLVNKNYATVS